MIPWGGINPPTQGDSSYIQVAVGHSHIVALRNLETTIKLKDTPGTNPNP
jgi:hypothetical protein